MVCDLECNLLAKLLVLECSSLKVGPPLCIPVTFLLLYVLEQYYSVTGITLKYFTSFLAPCPWTHFQLFTKLSFPLFSRIDISNREDRELNQDVGGSLTISPDAAIGVLMRMLKNAPGLRERLLSIPAGPVPQEPSSQRVMTEEHGSDGSSSAVIPSSLLRSRTAADALEELNRYKEIRESILNRGKVR
jgi:hypothetical protein